MSADVDRIAGLVTTILGVVGAFFTAFAAYARVRSPAPDGPNDGKAGGPRIRRFVSRSLILGLVVGISLVALPLGVFLLLTRGAPAPELAISSPGSGDRVGRVTDVNGRSAHLGSRQVWIFVQSVAAPELYPQPGPAQRLAGGAWSARAFFRYDGPSGTPFVIYAVLATPGASREISRYYDQRETRSRTARFFTLPEGAEIKDRTTVTPRAANNTQTACVHPKIRTATIPGHATITTLRSGRLVGSAVDPVEGTYGDLKPATRLWLVIYSTVAQRFYPTSSRPDEPAVLRGGRFRSAAYFGGQPGEHYEVAAVLATESASRVFSRTLRRWARTNDYVGLTTAQLPVGLEEKDCVAVVLRS
jgi:hypothetical protein